MRNARITMKSHYDAWQASGQSKKQYALDHSLSVPTFYYWARKFEGEIEPLAPSSTGFTQLAVPATTSDHPVAILHYPNGVRLDLYTLCDVSMVQQLITSPSC